MDKEKTTLIDQAAGDWEMLDDMVRERLTKDIVGVPERQQRMIRRATHSSHLTKSFTPTAEDEPIFVGAILQRYMEEIDTQDQTEPHNMQKSHEMLARLALALDALDGKSWKMLGRAYHDEVSNLEKDGPYMGWLKVVADGARLIRSEVNLNTASSRRETEDKEKEFVPDTIEGFESLRNTIVDLLHDDQATVVTPDVAAALVTALGVATPQRAISPERLKAYRLNALRWLSMQLSTSASIEGDTQEENEHTAKIARGKNYLMLAARRYPVNSKLSAPRWLAGELNIRLHQAEYIKHAESYMAFALDTLLRHSSPNK